MQSCSSSIQEWKQWVISTSGSLRQSERLFFFFISAACSRSGCRCKPGSYPTLLQATSALKPSEQPALSWLEIKHRADLHPRGRRQHSRTSSPAEHWHAKFGGVPSSLCPSWAGRGFAEVCRLGAAPLGLSGPTYVTSSACELWEHRQAPTPREQCNVSTLLTPSTLLLILCGA